jgi:hypothetical protein
MPNNSEKVMPINSESDSCELQQRAQSRSVEGWLRLLANLVIVNVS